ncbi:MAG: tRNA (adenosine(37)-N6)-threonylcarbamoyltransferase complex dimerization subunit type 1 TsaB [Deltaproteobacteria bacterium]|jgi:tRNA threonylcarbamoyladenosine biosynthesis protein TsaB|nr:tRNA (adenosine(37)-N6)-threonylcarbamoyltransferase complex dimerization subunit type 1 TsaB [Deltaproteobacteria bacterium]
MAILCIDTATADGLVVVARNEGATAVARWRSSGRHGENLFGYIESALADAGVTREEISLIGVNVGPGGFTSVRVGLATAKGLALGLDLPIVGVSALRVLARSIEGEAGLVRVPVMKAYRGDVFTAAYVIDGGAVEELVAPCFGAPDEVLARVRDSVGARPLVFRRDPATPEALLAEVRHVHRTEGPADLAQLEPAYLRPSDAELPPRSPTAHSSS